MAMVSPSKPKLVEKISWYTSGRAHQMWDRFSRDEQERMLEDDLTAGTRVSVLLAALIATGMVLSLITVVAVVLTR